jgi:hypothetical protein
MHVAAMERAARPLLVESRLTWRAIPPDLARALGGFSFGCPPQQVHVSGGLPYGNEWLAQRDHLRRVKLGRQRMLPGAAASTGPAHDRETSRGRPRRTGRPLTRFIARAWIH